MSYLWTTDSVNTGRPRGPSVVDTRFTPFPTNKRDHSIYRLYEIHHVSAAPSRVQFYIAEFPCTIHIGKILTASPLPFDLD